MKRIKQILFRIIYYIYNSIGTIIGHLISLYYDPDSLIYNYYVFSHKEFENAWIEKYGKWYRTLFSTIIPGMAWYSVYLDERFRDGYQDKYNIREYSYGYPLVFNYHLKLHPHKFLHKRFQTEYYLEYDYIYGDYNGI